MPEVEEIADAEVVEPGAELVTQSGAQTIFKTDDPVEIMQRTAEVARALKEFVKSQGLTSVISGRDYLLVEAWQMLGMMLGVTPGKVKTREVEHGWESVVELHDRTGRIVGAGEAECLDTEKTWKSRDDYARKSMAQTRAVGKAFRNTFGFIAKAAGYEATPAEEMPTSQEPATPPFGEAASPVVAASARKAVAWMLGELPVNDPAVTKVMADIENRASGYLPMIAARAVGHAAAAARAAREPAAVPGDEDASSETAEERKEREEREDGEAIVTRAENDGALL